MAHIVLDLETAPIDDARTYLTEPFDAPSNWKDPAKIAEFKAQALLKALERCSLDPDLCRIVALGWKKGSALSVDLCRNAQEEADLIADLWRYAAPGDTFVTYNGVGFDLPVLLRRSLYLGVKTPPVKFTRYQFYQPEVVDLMQILSHYGALTYRSLAFYSARFGLTPQDDDITGADVQQCLEQGELETIRKHCAANVQQTYELAVKLGVIPQPQVF